MADGRSKARARPSPSEAVEAVVGMPDAGREGEVTAAVAY